jgi:hypothetical protein
MRTIKSIIEYKREGAEPLVRDRLKRAYATRQSHPYGVVVAAEHQVILSMDQPPEESFSIGLSDTLLDWLRKEGCAYRTAFDIASMADRPGIGSHQIVIRCDDAVVYFKDQHAAAKFRMMFGE